MRVTDPAPLTGIVGLETLTLDTYAGVLTLPPLPALTTLVLHPGVDVARTSVRAATHLRIVQAAGPHTPPFTPDRP